MSRVLETRAAIRAAARTGLATGVGTAVGVAAGVAGAGALEPAAERVCDGQRVDLIRTAQPLDPEDVDGLGRVLGA